MDLIDLTGRLPPWPHDARRLFLVAHQQAASEDAAWQTPHPQGDRCLREALATHCGCDPGELLITPGARASATLLARRHRRFVVEQPTFSGIVGAIRSQGADVRLSTWDSITADTIDGRECVWITHPLRNPDGRCADTGLSDRLATIVANGGFVVINEAYRFHAPAASQLPHSCIVGTLSKIAGGGVRIGWVRTDSGQLKGLIDGNAVVPPNLWQRAVAYFLTSGGLEILAAQYCDAPRAAHHAFLEELSRVAGEHVEIPVPLGPLGTFRLVGIEEEAAVTQLERVMLRVGPGRDFALPWPGIRVSFTDVSPDLAAEAATRLAPAFLEGWLTVGDRTS